MTILPGNSTCKSCGARIVWCRTREGKRMPVDAEPHPEGNLVIDANQQAHVLTRDELLPGAANRFRSHFATCPHAAGHRKAAKAEPPPPAQAPRPAPRPLPPGRRLQYARARQRLSLGQAAPHLGLTWRELWEVEEGTRDADDAPGLLERAARLYGVPLYWLATGLQAPEWLAAAKGGGG